MKNLLPEMLKHIPVFLKVLVIGLKFDVSVEVIVLECSTKINFKFNFMKDKSKK